SPTYHQKLPPLPTAGGSTEEGMLSMATKPEPDLTPQQERYLIEEYKCLYTEILQRIQRVEEQLRYGLLASGGLWAWLLTASGTHPGSPWLNWGALLPPAIAAFLFCSWLVQDAAILNTAPTGCERRVGQSG